MGAQVRRTDLEHDAWTQAERLAGPEVAPLLARPLLGFEQHRASFTSLLEPPGTTLTLMIELDGTLRADGSVLPEAWIVGLTDRHTIVQCTEAYRVVELKLTPAGAHAILRRPLNELEGTPVALRDLFGTPGAEIADRLHAAGDWDTRFDLIEAFLAQRARDSQGPSPVVARALARLRETEGTIRIGALAAELNCSRRHLGSLFAEQIGVAPKTMARLERFEALCRRIDAQPTRWADIAADCGYADQPHLNREVRAMAGISPGELVSRRVSIGGLVGDGLPFVQDSGAAAA